jgi:hypothetical protein
MKKDTLKLLLTHPISILKLGLGQCSEILYKTQVKAKYGVEQLPTIDILDMFPDFHENLTAYSYLEGTSLVTDIMLLKSLARSFKKCSYLEIGSWRGESIANVAEVADNCTSITLSAAEMKALGFSDEFINVHGIYSKKIDNITVIEHNSQTFDFSKLNNKFDLIYIDGDHFYSGILNDTRKTFELRRDVNSIIVWHDYGFSTETVRHSVLAAILDGIPKEKHKNLFHISNTMCAIYMENRELNSQYTEFPSYPNKKFSIELKTFRL